MTEPEIPHSALAAKPGLTTKPGLTQWQRVVYTFSQPLRTFTDIRNHSRSWWLPFVITAIAGYLLFAVVDLKIGMEQVVENQIHISPKAEERMAQATPEQREMGTKISLNVTKGAFIASPALLIAGILLMSLGLLGTINFVFGGKAKYWDVVAVWMYAGLPGLIKVVLGVVVIYAGMAPESFNIKNYAPTNLGAFLNPVETNAAIYSLASSLDFVTIWTLVLLGMGVATVAGIKRSSGYIAVFGWWAIFVIVGTGWTAAFS